MTADCIPQWGASARQFLNFSEAISYYPLITRALADAVGPSARVLVDFGCGYGRFSRLYISLLGDQVAGRTFILVDAAEDMLNLTTDIQAQGATVIRIQDGALLQHFPAELTERVEAIACNASLYLLRAADLSPEIEPFLCRSAQILAPGGVVAANIPDQAYEYADGWQSEFYRHANQLWPDSESRARMPRFSDSLLMHAADVSGLELELSQITVPLTWRDFIAFYSIPAMGMSRLRNLSPGEREHVLQSTPPAFDAVQYRWTIATFHKRERSG